MENRYLLGSPDDFSSFIEGISKKDKIGCISHIDTDGVISFLFLNEILKSKRLKPSFVEFIDHGANVLKEILKKDYDILFFTDWTADNYMEDFDKLRRKGDVFVIDHHPPNEKLENKTGIIKTNYDYCSSHCLFDLMKKYIHPDKYLEELACAAIIRDYVWDKNDKNFELIKKVFPEVQKNETIWNSEPGKLGDLINSSLIYYNPNFKKVYDLIVKKDFSKMEKAEKVISNEVNVWIKKFQEGSEYFPDVKLRFFYGNPHYGITSAITNILSGKYFPDDTTVFVSDMKEEKGSYKVSSRNQTGKVNLNEILKKSIVGFEGAVAGGHAKASGASFPKKYLGTFKENLLKELENGSVH